MTAARNKVRPWDDARTYRREFEVRKITAQDIIDAVEKMKQLPVTASYTYYFRTDWVKPYVSEGECIQYFADNASVIVIDHKGREWWKGVQL